MPSCGNDSFIFRTVLGISPLGLADSRPSGVFKSISTTGKSAIIGMPSSTHSEHSFNSSSMVYRTTPGIVGTGSLSPFPSLTNTGRIKSFTVITFSRIRRLENHRDACVACVSAENNPVFASSHPMPHVLMLNRIKHIS